MKLDRIYSLAKRLKAAASLLTADGRVYSINPGVGAQREQT